VREPLRRVEHDSSLMPGLSYETVRPPQSSFHSASESITGDDDTDDFESVYSRSMSESDNRALSKLTPIKNADIGALIPVSVNGKISVKKNYALFFPSRDFTNYFTLAPA